MRIGKEVAIVLPRCVASAPRNQWKARLLGSSIATSPLLVRYYYNRYRINRKSPYARLRHPRISRLLHATLVFQLVNAFTVHVIIFMPSSDDVSDTYKRAVCAVMQFIYRGKVIFLSGNIQTI